MSCSSRQRKTYILRGKQRLYCKRQMRFEIFFSLVLPLRIQNQPDLPFSFHSWKKPWLSLKNVILWTQSKEKDRRFRNLPAREKAPLAASVFRAEETDTTLELWREGCFSISVNVWPALRGLTVNRPVCRKWKIKVEPCWNQGTLG